ncbi:MAG: hypothetical protein AAF404_02380 [Pseudomonadota bacterium]
MEDIRSKSLMLLVALFFIIAPGAGIASSMQETKVQLQSDLQKHIYRSLVNGAYHTLDSTTGEVRALYPHVSHPMILKMGDYFVMCADFRDANGNDVDIDFYMIKQNKRFLVFRAEIDNHQLLDGFMKSGKAKIYQ